MTLTGKGMMIWQIPNCEDGNVATIANMAVSGGFSHILIKIADGPYVYNTNKKTGVDLIPPLVSALRAKGIDVWGWQYIYGNNPTGEAAIAISQMKKYSMDGYVIDAESEFEQTGRTAVATTFMSALRAGLPTTPVALCSFRWPTYHPSFPWVAFLNKCDLNMPQVYWMSAHNPAAQLDRTLTEFKAITPYRPIVPMGPAFYESSWAPTTADETAFLDEAKKLGMTAANFFSWDDSRKNLPSVFTAISSYSWPTSQPTTKDITQLFIDALNSKNLDTICALFAIQCVHIDGNATIQGTTAIRAYFSNLLNSVLPSATFKLGTVTGSGSATTRSFAWTATSSVGSITDGNDTFGLINGQIAYHYSFFHVATT